MKEGILSFTFCTGGPSCKKEINTKNINFFTTLQDKHGLINVTRVYATVK